MTTVQFTHCLRNRSFCQSTRDATLPPTMFFGHFPVKKVWSGRGRVRTVKTRSEGRLFQLPPGRYSILDGQYLESRHPAAEKQPADRPSPSAGGLAPPSGWFMLGR